MQNEEHQKNVSFLSSRSSLATTSTQIKKKKKKKKQKNSKIENSPTDSRWRDCCFGKDTDAHLCACAKCSIISILSIAIIAAILFAAFPFAFRFSTGVQREFGLLRHVNRAVPNPESLGLRCVRSVKIRDYVDRCWLGVWYIPPNENRCNNSSNKTLNNNNYNNNNDQNQNNFVINDYEDFNNDDEDDDREDKRERIIVLYVHGVSGSRATRHRIERYRRWSNEMRYHVITFDYRGFGDSFCDKDRKNREKSNLHLPTLDRMTRDLRTIFRWILAHGISSHRVLIWAHSLGTVITIRLLATLSDDKAQNPNSDPNPLGAILVAPTTDTRETMLTTGIFAYYRALLPRSLFEYFFIEPQESNDQVRFDSIRLLPLVRCALLVMHAADDRIVPFELGETLYREAKRLQSLESGLRARFVRFAGELGYGHRRVFSDPNVPGIVRDFVADCRRHRGSSKT